MKMKTVRRAAGLMAVFVTALVIVLGTTSILYAQEAVGGLTGVVRDPSGAVVPGVSLVAKETATGVEASIVSDSRGIYTFSRLPPGLHTITITAMGFKAVEYADVRVISARVATLDFIIEIGQIHDFTTVVADAPTVDVTRTDSGTTRVYEEISQLPISAGTGIGRMAIGFLRTLPGVNYGISADLGWDTLVSQGALFGVGQATGVSPTTYNVDGVNAAVNLGATTSEHVGIMPETVEEFRLTTNVNAEYGANLGNVISFITKSGTNTFHGESAYYLRHEALNSTGWLEDTKPQYREKNWLINLGGPIVKDRTFFFGAFDIYRFAVPFGSEPGGARAIATVPTEAMRRGDFREWLGPQIGTDVLGRPIFEGQIYDPVTTRPDGQGGFIRDPFMFNGQLNVMDPARISAISRFFQDTYPLPNRPGLSLNGFYDPQTFGRDVQRVDFKVDHLMGKNRLTVGGNILFGYKQYGACSNSFEQNPEDFLSCVDATPANRKYRVSFTRTISPTLLLSSTVGYNDNLGISSTAGRGFTFGDESGLKGLLSPNIPFIIHDADPQTREGFSAQGFPTHFSRSKSSGIPISAALAWTRGPHELKFGVDFFRQASSSEDSSNTSGTWRFSPQATGLPLSPRTGNSWASFLLGDVTSVSMNEPSSLGYTSSQLGVYAQDQWRVSHKLTLNYGLRFDFGLPPKEEEGRMASFDPTLPNPAAGGLLGAVRFDGSGQGRSGRSRAEKNYFGAWGPRVGLAYQVAPRTVLRGYYGLAYSPIAADPRLPAYGAFSSLTLVSPDDIRPALNWEDGFPVHRMPPAIIDPTILNNTSVSYFDPDANGAARSHNLGFAVEQQVGRNMVLRGEYVGKITNGILFPIELNQIPISAMSLGSLLFADITSPEAQAAGIPVPYPGFQGSVAQALRPYPQYTSVSKANNRTGFSRYHAMIVTAQKHFGGGFSFLGGYTLSKLTGSTTAQHTDLGLVDSVFWGNVGIDRRHNFTLSWSYELPFGPGRRFLNSNNAFTKYVLGGWQVSGIQKYQSGAPIVISGTSSIPGVGAVWVDQVPGVNVRSAECKGYDPFGPNAHLLNRAAFANPAPFTFGTTRLANVTDCASKTEDISIRKNFPSVGRFEVQIGAELFNAFNRRIPFFWPFMILNIDNPDFGRTTVGSTPRQIQMFAKIMW